jgi:hypothetical protein
MSMTSTLDDPAARDRLLFARSPRGHLATGRPELLIPILRGITDEGAG